MTVVIAGGSGFLGSALASRLVAGGDEVVVLTRGRNMAHSLPGVRFVAWTPAAFGGFAGSWITEIEGADAVINLAGAGIADKRWNAARKQLLVDSRLQSTNTLVEAVRAASKKSATFVQASAIGYYGAFDNGPTLTEDSPSGSDFLATTCELWEREALPIASLGCRLVTVRTGIVLSRAGGALAKLLVPFKLFVGGPIASGRQWMSWIHLDDWIGLVIWAMRTPAVAGPLNATAPNPVTNREFSQALGRALHRPCWAPVPGFALRILLGEMADDLLIRGQRVLPERPRQLGYTFRYEQIDKAIAAAVR